MGEYLALAVGRMQRDFGFVPAPGLLPPAFESYCAAILARPGGGASLSEPDPVGGAVRWGGAGAGDLVMALIPADALRPEEREVLAERLAEWAREPSPLGPGRMTLVAVFLFAAGGEAALPEVVAYKRWAPQTGGLLSWLVDLSTARVYAHPGLPAPPPGFEALVGPFRMDDGMPLEEMVGEAVAVPSTPAPGVSRERREQWAQGARRFPVTTGLLTAIVLVFGWLELQGGSANSLVLIQWGANYGPLIALRGEYWRLLTSIFLHAGIAHLAMNGFVLYHMGRLVEALFGSRRFLALFVLSGLSGSLASLLLGDFEVPSVGASGALFGLFGAMVYFRMSAPTGWRIPWGNLLWPIAINLSVGLFLPNIDNWAHVGGLLGGLASAFLVGLPRRAPSRWRAASWALVAVLALSLVVGVLPVGKKGWISLRQGLEAFETGRYGEAEAHLRRAAQADPGNLWVHLYLAELYYRTDRWEAARREAREALALDPGNPYAREILRLTTNP